MTSERKVQANQKNAMKSTGPRTVFGKDRARMNAKRHGAFAAPIPFSGESQNEFDKLETSLLAEWKPQTVVERLLVGRIQAICWRLLRFEKAEHSLFSKVAVEMPIHTVRSLSLEERAAYSKALEEHQQSLVPRDESVDRLLEIINSYAEESRNLVEKNLKPTYDITLIQKMLSMEKPGTIVLQALSEPDHPITFAELDRLRRSAERDLVRTITGLIALQERREGSSRATLLATGKD